MRSSKYSIMKTSMSCALVAKGAIKVTMSKLTGLQVALVNTNINSSLEQENVSFDL